MRTISAITRRSFFWYQRARMKSALQPARQLSNWADLPQCNGKTGSALQTWVSNMISSCKGMKFSLVRPAGATLTIGDVEDTIYRDQPDEVNAWGKFYLEDEVKFQVIGAVEGTSCPYDQLVLMMCEDKKIYAYDGEELHVVAPGGLTQLRDEGIEYPASKTYYNGEAFKDMTEKDWDKIRKGPVGRKLDQEHHKVVMANKSRFMQSLRNSRLKRSVKSIEVS